MEESILLLNKYLDGVSEVIEALKIYYNTSGGATVIKNIENVDINANKYNKYYDNLRDTEVKYDTKKEYID